MPGWTLEFPQRHTLVEQDSILAVRGIREATALARPDPEDRSSAAASTDSARVLWTFKVGLQVLSGADLSY